ncbi:XdhC family protein [Bacillus songklensis]|uniref:XdhC family protein n=1 Tax=Bacillus songklensis TaxID=1069116 RepID=A0ABV8B6F7_9BACI
MNIYDILDAVETSEQDGVLATIIHVEGSAYLKEGTSMIFWEDGTQIGMVSPGCLEADLAIRAQEVFREGAARTVTYHLENEDDFGWGQGAGCNGILSILLEPLDEKLRKHLCILRVYLNKRIPVFHMKELTEDLSQTKYAYVPMDGQIFGNEWREDLPSCLESLFHNVNPFCQKSGIASLGHPSRSIYFHLYEPKPRLVVFGAGRDAQPVVSLAACTGFSVTVCDWRPAFCHRDRFPSADGIVVGSPEEIVEELCLQSSDFVVIMTHHFQKDREILSYIMKKKVRYAGVLGPHERTRRLLNIKDIPPFIHSPVGLAIGAKGPEEIAVSILAEMIQHLRKPFVERTHSI